MHNGSRKQSKGKPKAEAQANADEMRGDPGATAITATATEQ